MSGEEAKTRCTDKIQLMPGEDITQDTAASSCQAKTPRKAMQVGGRAGSDRTSSSTACSTVARCLMWRVACWQHAYALCGMACQVVTCVHHATELRCQATYLPEEFVQQEDGDRFPDAFPPVNHAVVDIHGASPCSIMPLWKEEEGKQACLARRTPVSCGLTGAAASRAWIAVNAVPLALCRVSANDGLPFRVSGERHVVFGRNFDKGLTCKVGKSVNKGENIQADRTHT